MAGLILKKSVNIIYTITEKKGKNYDHINICRKKTFNKSQDLFMIRMFSNLRTNP